MASTSDDATSPETAYNDLKRLTPSLAAELDHLRASLREHNLWLQRYGQGQGQSDDEALAAVPAGLPTLTTSRPAEPASETVAPQTTSAPAPARDRTTSPPPAFTPTPPAGPTSTSASTSTSTPSSTPVAQQPPSTSRPQPSPTAPATPASPDIPSYSSAVDNTLPPYAASEVPLYSSAVRDDVQQRRDQLMEYLREGEEVLRDYSARLADLARELGRPAEDADALGTWNEAAPDNALPSYTMIEGREELMVGGVGEVPPTYARGSAVEAAGRG
ncbi:hypothetical protein HMPREF1624_01635 [Sporothrix schenckii ATCC 58251]|uniref:Uncharacterized protein n=1 Tax=Sporothrix schenckii (strain ATCC 58251 / de Perez 2211183) TaxID=1391915 RepID=U7Q604_SPOS1|nr:hypothetical protein HMPREF1624_01635 [Sporothrix schenckii ATCC 58251]